MTALHDTKDDKGQGKSQAMEKSIVVDESPILKLMGLLFRDYHERVLSVNKANATWRRPLIFALSGRQGGKSYFLESMFELRNTAMIKINDKMLKHYAFPGFVKYIGNVVVLNVSYADGNSDISLAYRILHAGYFGKTIPLIEFIKTFKNLPILTINKALKIILKHLERDDASPVVLGVDDLASLPPTKMRDIIDELDGQQLESVHFTAVVTTSRVFYPPEIKHDGKPLCIGGTSARRVEWLHCAIILLECITCIGWRV